MRATQERAEKAVGLRAEHLDAVSFTTTPKGVAASALSAATSASCCAPSSTSTSAGSPTRSPTPRRRSTRARGSRRSTSPGPAASRSASRTTTGSRGPGCSPSTTTPSAASTTSTRCGATPTATSATTSSPGTTGRRPPVTATVDRCVNIEDLRPRSGRGTRNVRAHRSHVRPQVPGGADRHARRLGDPRRDVRAAAHPRPTRRDQGDDRRDPWRAQRSGHRSRRRRLRVQQRRPLHRDGDGGPLLPRPGDARRSTSAAGSSASTSRPAR